jgi:hypothetical protein
VFALAPVYSFECLVAFNEHTSQTRCPLAVIQQHIQMREKILSDHIKVKKKLRPTLNHHFNFKETSHDKEVIPEIFWIDLFYEKYGLKETVDLITDLTKLIEQHKINNSFFNCCLISNYEKLDDFDKSTILKFVKETYLYDKINSALDGMNYYFPNSPISFLLRNRKTNRVRFLKNLKKSILNLYNRTSINSTYALANAVYSQGIAGHLFFNSEIEKFDMNELLNYPNTDESKRVAALIRASIKPIIRVSIESDNPKWHKSFWQTCFELEPCKIKNLRDIEP